jgi:hypothetical protein
VTSSPARLRPLVQIMIPADMEVGYNDAVDPVIIRNWLWGSGARMATRCQLTSKSRLLLSATVAGLSRSVRRG